MKRLSLLGFVGLLASVLAGCPIYSGDGNGSGTPQGAGGYGGYSSSGNPSGCSRPGQCGSNETCGSDGQCHPGDCFSWGCPSGYSCEVDPTSMTASCQPGGAGGASSGGTGGSGAGTTSSSSGSGMGGSGSGTGGSGTGTTSSSGSTGTGGAPPVTYCGHPADCGTGQICGSAGTCVPGPCSGSNACIFGYACQADGTCASSTPGACDSNLDCSNGDLCIAGSDDKGGVCTTPANQCFDQSQCGTGENCVNGTCTLACATSADCRDGFTCTLPQGICSTIVTPCTLTKNCDSATLVCVGGACVPRSNGGTCPSGDVWDENGCVPDQGASFTCQTDGQMGAPCAATSVCLHHDCYISCDMATMAPCSTNSDFPVCKTVEDSGTPYDVCGASQSLGSECGAGSMGNLSCTGGKVCIDGFCK